MAIEALPEDTCVNVGVRYAEMEIKLGDIDRACAIYAQCSQVKVYIVEKNKN